MRVQLLSPVIKLTSHHPVQSLAAMTQSIWHFYEGVILKLILLWLIRPRHENIQNSLDTHRDHLIRAQVRGVSLIVTSMTISSHLKSNGRSLGHGRPPVKRQHALLRLVPHEQHVILDFQNVVRLTKILGQDLVQVLKQLRVVPFECVQV